MPANPKVFPDWKHQRLYASGGLALRDPGAVLGAHDCRHRDGRAKLAEGSDATYRPSSGCLGRQGLIGCMWFQGMLWKLPLPASDGLQHWIEQESTNVAFEFHRTLLKDVVRPHMTIFGPVVFWPSWCLRDRSSDLRCALPASWPSPTRCSSGLTSTATPPNGRGP